MNTHSTEKPANVRASALVWLWLAVPVIAFDQITKYLAESYLSLYRPLEVLPFFNLTLAYNLGAAFSFLSHAGGWQRWLFTGMALVVSVVIVYWLRRTPRDHMWTGAGLSLILGGAIGNVIDRLVHGHVIDFIQLYWRDFYWPAFNIADSAITAGVLALLLESMLAHKRATA